MILKLLYGTFISLLFTCTALAAEVDGEWDMVMSAAEGATMVTMTITVDGEIAHATAGTDKFTGTYKDGKLTLKGALYVPEAGMSSNMDLAADLVNDALTGTVNWDMYVADLVGTRSLD